MLRNDKQKRQRCPFPSSRPTGQKNDRTLSTTCSVHNVGNYALLRINADMRDGNKVWLQSPAITKSLTNGFIILSCTAFGSYFVYN